jgi:hypothetical protein
MNRKAWKFNFKTREYETYGLPEGATSSAWCEMDQVITCAECEKKMLYGDGYTSRKIHTIDGMGYIVCEQCYDKEYEEEKRYRNY